MSGILYIVGTPIGNMEDITLRAVRVLKEADMIAAEDTRHTKILLRKLNIETPTISFHQHSNPEKILSLLREGKNVALVSDAGTPGISDPGTVLVSKAIDEGVPAISVPGPSAFLAALSASGLPTDHFEFFGFIPQKKGRETFFRRLIETEHTAIFYESTHRIEKCARQLTDFLPDRTVVFARELTKIYEEFLRGTPAEILRTFEKFPEKKKGEFVVIVGGKGFRKK